MDTETTLTNLKYPAGGLCLGCQRLADDNYTSQELIHRLSSALRVCKVALAVCSGLCLLLVFIFAGSIYVFLEVQAIRQEISKTEPLDDNSMTLPAALFRKTDASSKLQVYFLHLTLKSYKNRIWKCRLIESFAVCILLTLLTNVRIEANGVDPDKTAPIGAIWSGFTLFIGGVWSVSTLFVEEASSNDESRRPLLNTITSRENLSTCSLRLPSRDTILKQRCINISTMIRRCFDVIYLPVMIMRKSIPQSVTNQDSNQMSCDMWFPTMWQFDKCRFRPAYTAYF